MMPTAVAAVCVATAVMFGIPAPAGPIQWCDPASPLYDAAVCYNESGPHRGYSCDPYGPAYDPDYCAAQR